MGLLNGKKIRIRPNDLQRHVVLSGERLPESGLHTKHQPPGLSAGGYAGVLCRIQCNLQGVQKGPEQMSIGLIILILLFFVLFFVFGPVIIKVATVLLENSVEGWKEIFKK